MQLNNNLTNDDGTLNQTGRILDILDFFFTLIFAFELSLNIFAHWFRTFINDGWNWCASLSHCFSSTGVSRFDPQHSFHPQQYFPHITICGPFLYFSSCVFLSRGPFHRHHAPARCGRFDFIVVSLSLVALGPLQVPVVVIRSMRAFRIARLFRRIKSLSSIIMALTASIIPVINAYLVLLIAMCICELPQRPTPAIGSPRAR